jgi:hypothetical protein
MSTMQLPTLKNQENKKPLIQVNHILWYNSFVEFYKEFPENPVMQYWCSKVSEFIAPKKEMNVMRLVTLSHKWPEEPVLVEVPLLPEIVIYCDRYFITG